MVAYTVYTVSAANLPDNNFMLVTVPFVGYGIMTISIIIISLLLAYTNNKSN